MYFCKYVTSRAPHALYGHMVMVHSTKVHANSIGCIAGIKVHECSASRVFLSQGKERESTMEQVLVLRELCVDTNFGVAMTSCGLVD